MLPQPPGSGGLADQIKALERRLEELTRKKGVVVYVQDDEPTTALVGDLWTPLTGSP